MFFLSDRLPRQSVDTPYQPAPKIASRLRGPAAPAVISYQLSVISYAHPWSSAFGPGIAKIFLTDN
jgi:hypothetical protein